MKFKTIIRFLRFVAVGASGVLVNMGILIALTEGFHIPYIASSLVAIELSILSNFALNNAWTWSDRRSNPLGHRLLRYHLVAGFTALTGNWCLLIILTSLFRMDYRIANLIGIAAGMFLNFLLNHRWTFRVATEESSTPAAGARSLPGISARWSVVIVAVVATALALRVAAMAGMVLLPEEAYYWMYSQHPSLSYFDHPPMVAWLIWVGTKLLGNIEFGVRLGGALLMLCASALMFIFGRMWFGRRAGLIAALLLQVLPAYFGAGLIATMDSALIFFWVLGLVGVSVALKRERPWGWYLAGIGLGAAMLSKYTGVFLGVGAVLAVIAHRDWRRQLLTPHPYAAALLALAMFAPVLIWNKQHEWASFRFQFADRFAGHSFSAASVLSYAGLQFVVATPVVLVAMIWFCARSFAKPRRMLAPRWIIAGCFSLPLLAVMGYKSLRYNIHLNWTLPLYLSLLPAVAQLGLAQTRRMRTRLPGFSWQKAIMATIVISAGADVLAIVYLLVVQPHVQWISALRPWSQLAANVQTIEERLEAETGHEPLVIAGGKYRLASELAFYRTPLERKARASDFTTSQWIAHGSGLGYPYWAQAERWTNSDCVIVDDNNEIDKFASRFQHFEVTNEVCFGRSRYRIAIGRGWRN